MSQLVIESREGRRIVGRIAHGEELHKRLLEVARRANVRAATLRGQGVIEDVSLAHYDRSSRAMGKARRLRGACTLLSLEGSISEHEGRTDVQVSCVVARAGDNGIEVLGGVVMGARVVAVEFVMDVMDDVMLRRRLDRQSGLVVWDEMLGDSPSRASSGNGDAAKAALEAAEAEERARVAEARSARAAFARPTGGSSSGSGSSGSGNNNSDHSSGSSSDGAGEDAMIEEVIDEADLVASSESDWATAAEASRVADAARAEAYDDDDGDDGYRPIQAGDLLDHNKFGRCVVERVDVNEEFATVRLRNNRLVRLNIEVLNLSYEGDEDGHQVFTTNPRR
ncbi:MAG: DNA-binding protein [Myxococcales bacterium]|nr:DNA-binding protein [Myxococcales bacterium]